MWNIKPIGWIFILVNDFNVRLHHMICNMKHNDLMTETTILVVHSFPFFLDVIHDAKAYGKLSSVAACWLSLYIYFGFAWRGYQD